MFLYSVQWEFDVVFCNHHVAMISASEYINLFCHATVWCCNPDISPRARPCTHSAPGSYRTDKKSHCCPMGISSFEQKHTKNNRTASNRCRIFKNRILDGLYAFSQWICSWNVTLTACREHLSIHIGESFSFLCPS